MSLNNMEYSVYKTTTEIMALTNVIYVNNEILNNCYKMVDDILYLVKYNNEPQFDRPTIYMNNIQRMYHKKAFNDIVVLNDYNFISIKLEKIIFNVVIMEKNKKSINCTEIEKYIIDNFNNIPFNNKQNIIIKINNCNIKLIVEDLENIGLIDKNTVIIFKSNDVQLENNKHELGKNIFNSELNLSTLGIGGLSNEFNEIFRKAFMTRTIKPELQEKMGIKHVKGMLLYGPPGCGKTLLARKIGQILNCNSIQIVNGPSLLNKYVGQSEENVRNLFVNAINDKTGKELHLIILDEIDALVKTRGGNSSMSDVGDKIVNQFLSMIDGPDELNNILLIGMTNRKDIIDTALLRPGRLEIHIEIGLPDEKGRLEILNIHCDKLKKNHMIDNNIDMELIAKKTKNYTGAELEGLVRNASQYAIYRRTFIENNIVKTDEKIDLIVKPEDFNKSINDMMPMFGKISNEINILNKQEFIFWHDELNNFMNNIIHKINNLNFGNKLVCLIHGNGKIGKTAFVGNIIKKTEIQCVRIISPTNTLKISDKSTFIINSFDECLKANESVLFLDNLDRLIEYISIGSRFNNNILQTILTILNYEINSTKKNIIFITLNSIDFINDLGITADEQFAYPTFISDENKQKYFNTDCDYNNIADVLKILKFN